VEEEEEEEEEVEEEEEDEEEEEARPNLIPLAFLFSRSLIFEGRGVLNFFALAFKRSISMSFTFIFELEGVPTSPFTFFLDRPILSRLS